MQALAGAEGRVVEIPIQQASCSRERVHWVNVSHVGSQTLTPTIFQAENLECFLSFILNIRSARFGNHTLL